MLYVSVYLSVRKITQKLTEEFLFKKKSVWWMFLFAASACLFYGLYISMA